MKTVQPRIAKLCSTMRDGEDSVSRFMVLTGTSFRPSVRTRWAGIDPELFDHRAVFIRVKQPKGRPALELFRLSGLSRVLRPDNGFLRDAAGAMKNLVLVINHGGWAIFRRKYEFPDEPEPIYKFIELSNEDGVPSGKSWVGDKFDEGQFL